MMARNGAGVSVDYLCNNNNFECSILGMVFRHDHKQTIRKKLNQRNTLVPRIAMASLYLI